MLRLLVHTRHSQRCGIISTDQGGAGMIHTLQMTENTAAMVIDSVVDYLMVRNGARPWSTYCSMLLAEAAALVTPVVKRPHEPTPTTREVIASIERAKECLQMLAEIKSHAVDLSIKRLAYVLDEVNAARHSSIETPLGGGSLYGDYRTDDIWSGYWELERGLLQGQ